MFVILYIGFSLSFDFMNKVCLEPFESKISKAFIQFHFKLKYWSIFINKLKIPLKNLMPHLKLVHNTN